MNAASSIIVVKLGGSLLDLPDWPVRLEQVCRQRPGTRQLLVVGGGRIVDEVRRWDAAYRLGDELADRLALHGMQVTAELAATLLPGACVVRDIHQAEQAWRRAPLAIWSPLAFVDRPADGLCPRSWDVTSDSLAACLAGRFAAEELLLLKSAPLPASCTVARAAELGLVDPRFPLIAGTIPRLTWCNLREVPPPLTSWIRDAGATV